MTASALNNMWLDADSSRGLNICLGEEVYQFGNGASAVNVASDKDVFHRIDLSDGTVISADSAIGIALVEAINNCSQSYWAMADNSGDVYVYFKEGGDHDQTLACDEAASGDANSRVATKIASWQNMEEYTFHETGTTFGNGGEDWGTLNGVKHAGRWGLKLSGRDVGEYHDLRVCEIGSAGSNAPLRFDTNHITQLEGFHPDDFAELQNAEDGPWHGAHLRTQSHAQEALDAIGEAINRKDKVRASLGAFQNRLENTITNLGIMAENLQASESRISDVDVATEMTEFTKNNIMAQAATSMLSQANSLPQLALSLLG
jgi:flagellin-like hook-associated protein FlgL